MHNDNTWYEFAFQNLSELILFFDGLQKYALSVLKTGKKAEVSALFNYLMQQFSVSFLLKFRLSFKEWEYMYNCTCIIIIKEINTLVQPSMERNVFWYFYLFKFNVIRAYM